MFTTFYNKFHCLFFFCDWPPGHQTNKRIISLDRFLIHSCISLHSCFFFSGSSRAVVCCFVVGCGDSITPEPLLKVSKFSGKLTWKLTLFQLGNNYIFKQNLFHCNVFFPTLSLTVLRTYTPLLYGFIHPNPLVRVPADP